MLRVAITGAHGVGKTTIVNKAAREARVDGWRVLIVNSPTRDLKALAEHWGITNNLGLDYQFEWMVMAEMRKRQWEAEVKMRFFERPELNLPTPALIIGDRCLLDPLSYTLDNLTRLITEAQECPTGEPNPELNRMKMLYDLAHGFCLNDVEQFWHKVYYKPPHPDHLEADSDRLGDRNYQLDLDGHIRHHWAFAAQARGVATDTLDIDRDKAADEVWEDVKAMYDAQVANA